MTPCIDLLLVDDEQIAREGLRRIIDWEALGYRICAEAGNGEEALEKIRLYQPGLVLLDIRLPGINGTEVIRKAREMGFTGEVIFLTAYSDFAYTQQAIRYGASGYLIKPIDTIELQSLVLAARARIEASDSNRLRLNQYRSKTREKVLFDLLTGAGFDPAVNYYELGLSAPGYQVVIYESYSPFFHQNDFAGLLMSGTEDGGDGQLRGIEQLQLDQQQVLLLMSPAAISRFQAWIGHLQESFEKNSYMDSIFFVYGEVVPQLQDIGRSYHQCQDLIRRRFFLQ